MNPDLSSIWFDFNNNCLNVIDQRFLPYEFKIKELNTVDDVCEAISDMIVRGAPLIGVCAAYGIYFAFNEAKTESGFYCLIEKIKKTRPTAVNLINSINIVLKKINKIKYNELSCALILESAEYVRESEINNCYNIGKNGLEIIKEISSKKNDTVNILTHCNAGWLACVKYGTATAPIYLAHENGIKVHVWVDETRPRNQGAKLTAWELEQKGIDFTLIADNTGGHLMQNNMVDMVIVGSDRTALNGDVANKIGTYLKALSANDNSIPFYVALPLSTFDLNIKSGKEIPIEIRSDEEVKFLETIENGKLKKHLLTTNNAKAINYGFDITPARLVTKLITEKGIIDANEKSINNIFEND